MRACTVSVRTHHVYTVYTQTHTNTGKIYAMKSIRKAHVVKNNKVRHTLAERNIMQKITHPFVMKLHYAFQNDGKLYSTSKPKPRP